MSDFVQLVKKMAAGAQTYGTFKPLLARFTNYIGLEAGLTLIKQRGLISSRYLPICHDKTAGRLLMWSSKLESVVDLTKLVPKPTTAPACYAAMFQASGVRTYVRPEIKRFSTGTFDEDDLAVLADILCGAQIEEAQNTILCETLIRNYPEAILESST